MIVGGGGVGDSRARRRARTSSTSKRRTPRYQPGPDLPAAGPLPEHGLLPDDTVFTTGGSSSDYRGGPSRRRLRATCSTRSQGPGPSAAAAESTIGRNYHSEALLLPDGRVVTLGSRPAVREHGQQRAGTFEQRVEIYSPPYLFDKGPRPTITSAPSSVERRSHFTIRTGAPVTAARLVRPSATTHVTDLEQRSVALSVDGPQPARAWVWSEARD